MNIIQTSKLVSLAVVVGFMTAPVYAERYDERMVLRGPATPTDVSGFKGTSYTVGVPNPQGDDFAMYGIASQEKGDKPCFVTIRSENVNDSGKTLDTVKNLCDGKAKSKEIKVEYGNGKYNPRTFVTGVQVCLNNKGTRVKGLKIRGKTIAGDGALLSIEDAPPPKKKGGMTARNTAPKEPKDDRAHCNKNWKKWAQCPDGHIATAAVLHYGAGKKPQSLTGIGLKCRSVSTSNR